MQDINQLMWAGLSNATVQSLSDIITSNEDGNKKIVKTVLNLLDSLVPIYCSTNNRKSGLIKKFCWFIYSSKGDECHINSQLLSPISFCIIIIKFIPQKSYFCLKFNFNIK